MAAHLQTSQSIDTVKIQSITRETFAAFGHLLTHEGLTPLPIHLYGDRIDTFRPAYFESDQPVEYLLTRSRIRDYRVIFLERHLELTQSFIPLAGHPFLIVVARPNCPEQDGIPSFSEIKAFLVPGYMGVNIHRGTWHEVPFPLIEGGLMLVTSHRSLTQGLESKLNEKQEIRKLDVEKRNVTERTGRILKVELP